jgi:DNA replication protein DnaC
VTDLISPDLKTAMRRLRLGKLLDTLPERVALARQQKMAHQDFLFLLLSDECQRRDSAASSTRAKRALLEPEMQLERWDSTAKVTFDQALLNELVSMRFVEAHRHLTIVGPVGVGKTFIAQALGHIACRHKYSVLAVRADKILKALKHARLDHTYEAELRKLISVDLLLVDDFGLDAMDATESRDVHEILTERDRAGSMIITTNQTRYAPSSKEFDADPGSGYWGARTAGPCPLDQRTRWLRGEFYCTATTAAVGRWFRQGRRSLRRGGRCRRSCRRS